MRLPRPLFLIAMALLGALSACRADDRNNSTPTPPPTPTPIRTPTPAFHARVLDLAVRTAGQPGDWQVLGLLENTSDYAVAEVQLLVALRDPRGAILAETTTRSALPHLAPGEVTPFEARFQGVGAVTGAQARVVRALRTSLRRGELQVTVPEAFLGEDGNTLLLGTLSGPDGQPLAINGLLYAGLDDRAELRALAPALYAPSWLEPGDSLPFLAQAVGDQRGLRWIAFSDAVLGEAPLQHGLTLVEEPVLQWTEQGRAFAIGEVANISGQSREAALLFSVRHGEQVLSLTSLVAPFPIEPGERLPFGQSDFPGLSLRLEGVDPAEVTLEAWVDPRASAASLDQRAVLQVQVDSLDGLGSVVFLRGSVSHAEATSLHRPSLYAALRTTDGELLSAAWRQLAPRLAAGERLAFVLDLPLPAGADLAMLEFDVLGFGVQP